MYMDGGIKGLEALPLPPPTPTPHTSYYQLLWYLKNTYTTKAISILYV